MTWVGINDCDGNVNNKVNQKHQVRKNWDVHVPELEVPTLPDCDI